MNGTATDGKNLQTPEQADNSKGAYEMGLLSPAAPNAEHHPIFSSLAKRQRTPLSQPSAAANPVPVAPPISSARADKSRAARNYGGRNMRYRWADQLKPWQVHMLHQADAVASALGLPLNTFATVSYHGTFPGGAAMASTFKAGLKRMCQWLRDNGTRAAYVYVHENPSDEKPNTHVLVHVPPRLLHAFKAKAGAWFDALDGGVKVDPRNDTQRRAKGHGTRLAYMCKGADDLTCRRYGGRRAKGGQGPIHFKRAGISRILSKGDFVTRISREAA